MYRVTGFLVGCALLAQTGVASTPIVQAGVPLARPAVLDPWPEAPSRQLIESPSFQLLVPFRTQKDGSRWQSSNCGPAALGMLLDGFGITGQETDDLRLRAHTYQGTVGMRTGTGLEHVAHVAEDLGLLTYGLYNSDGSYRHWSPEDVASELRRGHPVMPLVRLYLVPGYEGMATRWGHYIVLTGIVGDGFYFSDPLKTDPIAGVSGVISRSQLAAAMNASHIPGQAASFGGPGTLAVNPGTR